MQTRGGLAGLRGYTHRACIFAARSPPSGVGRTMVVRKQGGISAHGANRRRTFPTRCCRQETDPKTLGVRVQNRRGLTHPLESKFDDSHVLETAGDGSTPVASMPPPRSAHIPDRG